MNIHKTRPAIWIAALISAGAIQYTLPAILATLAGAVQYWKIPDSFLEKAGPERYLKDIISVAFAIYWPFRSQWKTEVLLYLPWILILILMGLLAYFIQTGYPPFLLAGFRWVILLHNAFGIYVLVSRGGVTARGQRLLLFVALFWLLFSLTLSVVQLKSHGALAQIGKAREPGIFSLGAVNGYYGASVAMIALASRNLIFQKWMIYLGGMLVGALSGTRFTILCILLIVFIDNLDKFKRVPALRYIAYFSILPIVVLGSIFAAGSLSGRGDVLSDQVQDGGRFGNGLQVIEFLSNTGDRVDFFIGRGLGQGTNAAMSIVGNGGYNPEWQVLVDNTMITSFIQFGWVGSIWLSLGILGLFWSLRKAIYFPFYGIVILSVMTQNVFEQFYWMLALGYFLGLSKHEYINRSGLTVPII